MSDGAPRDLGSVFYPKSPTPGPASPAPTERPTNFAEALYGGPVSPGLARAREVIDAGKTSAPEPHQYRGTPVDRLPHEADPRTVARDQRPQPEPRTLGAVMYGEAKKTAAAPQPEAPPDADPAADAETRDAGEQQQPGQPDDADTALLAEFNAVVEDYLDKPEADRLLELHEKSVKSLYDRHEHTVRGWKNQTENGAAGYSRQQLEGLRHQMNSAIGSDRDAQEFKRLMAWSGLGNNPSVVKVMGRLLGRR